MKRNWTPGKSNAPNGGGRKLVSCHSLPSIPAKTFSTRYFWGLKSSDLNSSESIEELSVHSNSSARNTRKVDFKDSCFLFWLSGNGMLNEHAVEWPGKTWRPIQSSHFYL